MKIYKVFFFVCFLFNINILCQAQTIKQAPWDMNIPGETERSKDEAYSAPTSLLIGTWIRYGYDGELTIKSDGTFSLKHWTDSRWEGYGIRIGQVDNGTWKRSGNYLDMTSFSKDDKFFYDENEYNKLSARLRNDFITWYVEEIKYLKASPNKKKESDYYIVYLNKNFLGLAYGVFNNQWYAVAWYVRPEYINAYEEEKLQKRKEENAWGMAQNTNTIEAYQEFVNKYPSSGHIDVAKTKIQELIVEKEWEDVKKSNSSSVVMVFIKKYPNFDKMIQATTLYYSLLGMEYYNEGDEAMAITTFKKIKNTDEIAPVAKKAYLAVLPTIEFQGLSAATPIEKLQKYLQTYPLTPYKAQVRNYIATALTEHFNLKSTSADYDEALSYASGNMINVVKRAIALNEEKIKEDKKEKKRLQREADGGTFGIYLEYANISWNNRKIDGIFNYNFGIKFKVNNWQDRFQCAVGILPGVGIWDFENKYNPLEKTSDEKEKKLSRFFQLPVEVEAKVNLAKLSENTWFFIDARYSYNALRKKEVMAPMGFHAGLGFSSKEMDVTLLYGRPVGKISSKYDMINGYPNPFKLSSNNNYIGISLGYVLPLKH